jgi:hypothetical protein
MKIRNTVNLVLLLKSQMLIKNLEIVKDIYIYIYCMDSGNKRCENTIT